MDFPITPFRERIVQSVIHNPVTIVVAETGSGKSTQVPRFLLEEGYRVLVTQPRRLAAYSVAEFVASKLQVELGDLVGVRTRDEKRSTKDTRLLFATDGLVVMRELMGQTGYDVLIIDEVHEWNLHIEALVALARQVQLQDRPIKIVIMSATIDAEKLSAYFDDAPIITVLGRLHPVKKLAKGESILTDAVQHLKRGLNTLIFVPGKKEIRELIYLLKTQERVDAEVLPLHAELTSVDQQRCFQHYGRPKCIVATSVAQTSITIDDIDLVIDSGLENRIEMHAGVSGLYERAISLACALQRRGRAGRTKPGYYIDHSPNVDRTEFPLPEILRTRLDQLALRLALIGQRISDLTFFHEPNQEQVQNAERLLRDYDCLHPNYTVTKKGGRIALMPVSVEAGCMLIEAEKQGVITELLPSLAIFESNGIVDGKGYPDSGAWRELCLEEKDSDLLAQSTVWQVYKRLPRDQKQKYTLLPKSLERAEGILFHLERYLESHPVQQAPYQGREGLLAAIRAGLKTYSFTRVNGQRRYQSSSGVERKLSRVSVIAPHNRIVGVPWDICPELGKEVIYLINFATLA